MGLAHSHVGAIVIMKAVEKAVEEVAKLLDIREDTIDKIMCDIPRTMANVNRVLYKLEHSLEQLLLERKQQARTLRAWYSGESWASSELGRKPFGSKVPVSVMNTYIDSDELMIETDSKIGKLKVAIAAVERELKTLQTINWVIRTYVDRAKYVR